MKIGQKSKKNFPKGPDSYHLGELLIKQGYLKRKDLEKALEIQDFEKKLKNLPIGQILIKLGILSANDVDRVMGHPEVREKIGELAVAKGLLSEKQVAECMKKKGPEKLLGQVFIQEGLIDPNDLEKLLKEQIKSPRFGEVALKLRLITDEDLQKALNIQKYTRRLGEILCDLDLIDPIDLNRCLEKKAKHIGVGETLVSLGYITEDELYKAYSELKFNIESLEDVLIRKKLISEKDLQIANSHHYNIPFKSLDNFIYSAVEKHDLIKIISKKYAETKLILPISCKDNKLTIGLFQPEQTLNIIYELKETYRQYSIFCVLITREKFEELFEVLYSASLNGSGPRGEGDLGPSESEEMDFMALDIEEELGNGEVKERQFYGRRDIEAEEIVNFILSYGIVNGASDIHIEQNRKGVVLRYRFDGLLKESKIGWLKEKLRDKAPAVISRIKVLSNLDIAEKRLPQDGAFRIEYIDKTKKEKIDLDFRVATCQASVGENVTIRILDPRKANVGLDKLNHSDHVLGPFTRALKSPAGIILVCGPTGSGKTSTLYAALQYIDNPSIKIITVEDPIEYQFPTLMQTQINSKIGVTFSRLLRSFLRFDPDVILVGEMRDEDTAKIGFDAAQTGHLILSTLHTNDALSAISRLIDLKVEYGQIASSLMCVLAQRLIRKICTSCIEEYIPPKDEWSVLFKSYPSHLKFYHGIGCETCNYTGYAGRTIISEIFSVTPEISQALMKGYDESQIIRLALESGVKTMLEDSLLKLNQTTLSEIIRMVPHDMIKRFRLRQHSQENVDLFIEEMLGQGGQSQTREDLVIDDPGFEISNPETERAKLDLIVSAYEDALKKNNGNRTPSIDPVLFKDFIMDSFYKVYEQQPCKSMTFNIINNKDSGKINISVTPNL